MSKKGFTIIEVVVVFLLMLGVVFLVLPKSLDTTRQARFISKWSEKFSELEYMFSVIKAQKDGEIQEKLNETKSYDDKEKIMLEALKPYLRITSDVRTVYNPVFMDKTFATPGTEYYFNKFYFTSSNEIVGIKLINPDCKNEEVCTIISIDLNGLDPPNTWGYDVYGVNVFPNKIEPLGKGIDPEVLKKNCSKVGSGLYCSYYYLIGGKFD